MNNAKSQIISDLSVTDWYKAVPRYLPLKHSVLLTESTAAIRADLEDFNFDFVQGTFPHTEGESNSGESSSRMWHV